MKQKRTDQEIIHQLKVLHAEGADLRPSAMQRGTCQQRSLYQAAVKRYGSYRKAMRAAGLEHSSGIKWRRKQKRWTKERICRRIVFLIERGVDLSSAAARRKYSRLYQTARSPVTGFGSWKAALEACGVDYEAIVAKRRLPDKSALLEALQELRAAGDALRAADHPRLHAAAKKHFPEGGWKAALAAAGIDLEALRAPKYSRERIVAEIRSLAARGNPLKYSTVPKNLYFNARRGAFSSWREAVKAALSQDPHPEI